MNNTRKFGWVLGVVGLGLALSGCLGDSDDEAPVVVAPPPVVVVPPPVVVTPLPEVFALAADSAGASAAAFLAYLLGFNPSDESNQPLTFKEGFAVPADETSEPMLLI